MKKSKEKLSKKEVQNNFYKTNPSGGISLIVLVITIIVVIILAAAVIISLQNNNPMVEANKARINSDVANMQAIFTNTVGKIMAENQDVVQVVGGQLYTETTGNKKTRGEATYKIMGADGTVAIEGKIIFGVGEKLGTTYYTGKELPLYGSDTKWYVDSQGLLSVEVGGVPYGEGEQVEDGEEIEKSGTSMLKRSPLINIIGSDYSWRIKKIKFVINEEVPSNKIESWDVSDASDSSVMAWTENDENGILVLKISGKKKIIANPISYELFKEFFTVTEIENLELLDTTQVTNMYRMFNNCRALTNLDLRSFDTSNVTNMEGMFVSCINLTSLDLSSFDTSNVTSMDSMFNGCSSLTSLDVSSFNTSNVTTMYCMFANCEKMTDLNLGNSFNTSKVTHMGAMFIRCGELMNLDLENLDTTNVTDISQMFQEATKLNTTITIKASISKYSNMFNNAATAPNAKIVVNYMSTAGYINSMIATKSENSNVVKGIQVD